MELLCMLQIQWETYLNGTICEMHDNGASCPEPGVQMWNTRQCVVCSNCIATSLHQVIGHIALEVGQQFHFLLKSDRIGLVSHIRFMSFLVDVMHITEKIQIKRLLCVQF